MEETGVQRLGTASHGKLLQKGPFKASSSGGGWGTELVGSLWSCPLMRIKDGEREPVTERTLEVGKQGLGIQAQADVGQICVQSILEGTGKDSGCLPYLQTQPCRKSYYLCHPAALGLLPAEYLCLPHSCCCVLPQAPAFRAAWGS